MREVRTEVRMEPMGVGQMLDRTLRLFFGNFLPIAGVALLLYLPGAAVELLLAVLNPVTGKDPMSAAGHNLVGMIIYALLGIVLSCTVTYYIGQICLGNPCTMRAALGIGFSRFGAAFSARFQVGLWVILGMILLVLPGLYWSILYVLVTPIIMLDDPDCDALKRSESLVKDQFWPVLALTMGMGTVVAVLILMLGLAEGAVLGLAYASAFGNLDPIGLSLIKAVGSITGGLFAPVYAITATILYFDCRVRKEGLDLETMDGSLSEA